MFWLQWREGGVFFLSVCFLSTVSLTLAAPVTLDTAVPLNANVTPRRLLNIHHAACRGPLIKRKDTLSAGRSFRLQCTLASL